jgi:hypothetical protein
MLVDEGSVPSDEEFERLLAVAVEAGFTTRCVRVVCGGGGGGRHAV